MIFFLGFMASATMTLIGALGEGKGFKTTEIWTLLTSGWTGHSVIYLHSEASAQS